MELLLSRGDFVYPSEELYHLHKCCSCGLVCLPDPAAVAAATAYPASYFKRASGLARALEKFFNWRRVRFLAKYRSTGDVLDFGCGSGEFVRALTAAGVPCFGLDPHAPETGSDGAFVRGTLDTAALRPGALGAVTAWHVLEHLADPHSALLGLRRLMAEEGSVLIVSVPNISSWQAALNLERWFYLDLPRHLRQYSPETLKAALGRAGFTVAGLSHFSLEYGPYGWWQTILNILGCEPDFAFKYLKRGDVPAVKSAALRAYTVFMTAVLAPVLIPLSVLLSWAESAAGRGGVITAAAVPGAPGGENSKGA